MKSERRHDLETNELAVQVQDWLDHLKPYASQIGLVLVGLVVLAVLASQWGSATSSTEEAAWDEYTLASYSSDPDWNSMKLLAENEEYKGTVVPEWAFLAWSDRQTLRASQAYLIDRQASMTRLEQVEPIYKQLAEGASNSQIQDRAHFGLARVLEMRGKIKDARTEYGRVKGDLTTLAEERAEQLETKNVDEACDWLATAELPKRELPAATGAAGTRPSFEAEVPAPMPNTPVTDTRSLEEILTGESGESADENRYGEEAEETAPATDAGAEGSETSATGESGTPPAESVENTENEKPAIDAAGQ